MASQKSNDLRRIAKRLAKDPATPQPTRRDPPPTWAAFRPITGYRTDQPLPPVEPIVWRRGRKPGQRVWKQEPTELFLMNMLKREKRQWQRTARDIGLPL